jgi:hypothetical protein
MPTVQKGRPTKTVGNPPLLLALGDSIVWGQGLCTADKFCSKVAKTLKLVLHNRAYSGATVMCGSGPDDLITAPGYVSPVSGNAAASGEVPRSKPTILEQAASYDGDPDGVPVILVDGGINEVNINNLVGLPRQDLARFRSTVFPATPEGRFRLQRARNALK